MYLVPRTGNNHIFNTDCLFNDNRNNCPCHHRCFGETGGAGGSPSKDKGTLKKWLDRLADPLERLAGKAVEALPAIVGSLVGGILSFLGKAVGFVAENIWTLIVFVAGLVGWWLMQKVKKD